MAETTTTDDVVRRMLDDGSLTVDLDRGLIYKRGDWHPGSIDAHGYLVAVVDDGRKAFVHRIVYIAAHGSVPNGLVLDHLNGDKFDNRAANLEAVTRRENALRYHRRAHHYHERATDRRFVDPALVAAAEALAATNPSRDEIAAFMLRQRAS
jgi:hypothetical protein